MRMNIRNYKNSDFDEIVKLTLLVADTDLVDPFSTLESMPTASSVDEALKNSILSLVVTDSSEKVIGYATVRYWEEDDGTCVYLHQQFIDPSIRESDLPETLLKAIQEQIQKHASDYPGRTEHAVYGGNATESEAYMTDLFLSDGYKGVWAQVEMEFKDFGLLPSITNPPLGITDIAVQESDDALKRRIYKANKRVYRGWFGSSPESEEDYQEFLEENPDVSLWKVSVSAETGETAGFVTGVVDGVRGEIWQVTVVDKPEFRRKGLAIHLMRSLLKDMHERSVQYVRLQTDAAGNRGGRQLYEKLGFKPLKTHYRYRKPLI